MKKSFLSDESAFLLCNYSTGKQYTKEIEFIVGINFNFCMIHLNFIV
jgi:hypothetical protein